jgi:mRNA interferase MazF
MVTYVPDRGDIVWLQFNTQSGHEQAGRRPALTLSPKAYNQKVGLAIFCPLTNQEKGYPFEVKLEGNKISGVILADQVKSLDWRKREAEFIVKAPSVVITKAIGLLKTLIS